MRKLIVCVAAFVATPALAMPWHVDPVTSRLTFEAEQSGEKFTGSFQKFKSAIDFDTAAPENANIEITVDMTSVQVEGKDRLEALPTSDWFAAKQFPTAKFTSTSIKTIGSDEPNTQNYLLNGTLTIRDMTKAVSMPFSLKTVGTSARARGELVMNRRDFGVGQGQWKGDEYVKFPVTVRFELNASR